MALNIGPGSGGILEPTMVLCSESAWNRYGFGTMITEDLVLVTNNEPARLSTLSRELYTI